MNIVFIHQNMPGQFVHIARSLAADPRHHCAFITRRADVTMPGVERITYNLKLPQLDYLSAASGPFNHQVLFAEAVARCLQALNSRGFQPDVIVGHPGWGELLFVKDVCPAARLISYCEFYHRPGVAMLNGDPARRFKLDEEMARRAQSAHLLLSLEAADQGWSPTRWQRGLHPEPFHSKIAVIADGVDTDVIAPSDGAKFAVPGLGNVSSGDEVITFTARSLEPSRGFPDFMRALPEVLRCRPKAQVIIAGSETPHYDLPPAPGDTWRAFLEREAPSDPGRVHFVGHLNRTDFVSLLQVSSLHVHLSYPTVLSWSLLEAMAAGCLILGSATPPNLEFLAPGSNSLVCDPGGHSALWHNICEALGTPFSRELRTAARRTAETKASLAVCLPRQLALITGNR